MARFRFTKLSATAAPKVPPASWDHFVPGQPHEHSLPIDYVLEGSFVKPPRPGAPLVVLRTSRNGVKVPGVFTSTCVRALYAITDNSVYRIELIPAEVPTPDNAD